MFFFLLKIWVTILVKDISKNVSGKYSPKCFDHAKQAATDALKTSS